MSSAAARILSCRLPRSASGLWTSMMQRAARIAAKYYYASTVLTAVSRGAGDRSHDLWTVCNKVQEHVMCGGIEDGAPAADNQPSHSLHRCRQSHQRRVVAGGDSSHPRVVESDIAGARN